MTARTDHPSHHPTHRPSQRAARSLLAAGTATALVALSATAASAHVRVFPDTTDAGGYAELNFRVPTESETAGTVRLEVELPTDTPFTSVQTTPMPGWDAEVVTGELPTPVDVGGATITQGPLRVVWTAQPGAEVGPGQYETFDLSVGPLPEAGTGVLMPATQTYSDGEEAAWVQPAAADGTEPEMPAPVFQTTEAAAGGHGSHGGSTDESTDGDTDLAADAAPAAGTSAAGSDTTARVLGGGGLALGLAAFAVALLRGRRSA